MGREGEQLRIVIERDASLRKEALKSKIASIGLSTLNGTLHVYDGEVLTRELWARMRDFNASNPVIASYIEWLRRTLAPEPHEALNVPWYPRYRYWWFNDHEGWRAETPGNDTVVRVGVVKLPFGAGLIVTAYQAGDHLDIVVHGTIINGTGVDECGCQVLHVLPGYPLG